MCYNMAMQKIATDIQTFERLREEGFTYVDKTGILWQLANGSGGDARVSGGYFHIGRRGVRRDCEVVRWLSVPLCGGVGTHPRFPNRRVLLVGETHDLRNDCRRLLTVKD